MKHNTKYVVVLLEIINWQRFVKATDKKKIEQNHHRYMSHFLFLRDAYRAT